MFKIVKWNFLKYLDFFFLKKERIVLYNQLMKINIFWRKKKYIIYSGRKYLIISIKDLNRGTKIGAYSFSKKPFSGPTKKFKV